MKRYLSSIKRYCWIVLACTLLASGIGVFMVKTHAPVYGVSSTLLVNANQPGNSILPTLSSSDSLGLASNYATEIMSRSVMQFVYSTDPQIKKQGYVPDDLLADVSTSASPTASTITITATTSNRSDAVLLANDVATGFQAYIQQQILQQLNAQRTSLTNQIAALAKDKASWEGRILAINNNADPRISIYQNNLQEDIRNIDQLQGQLLQLPATATSNMSIIQLASPGDVTPLSKNSLIIAVTFAVGLILGIVIMLLMIFLDNRLQSEEQVKEKLGLAYIGGLSNEKTLEANPTRITSPVSHELSDIYANLRLTGVLPAGSQAPSSTVLLVTSPQVAEGKSTIAAALSATVAQGGGAVVVVDGNLRQPSTHLAFGMSPAGPGLSGLLKSTGSEAVDDAVLRTKITGVWLLPAGAPMDQPTYLLGQKMPAILAQLRKKIDLVIIDGPALLSGADACLLANMADGIALVVDIRHGKLPLLLRVKEMLSSLTSTPSGVILNRLPRRHRDQYFATAYPGGPMPEKLIPLQINTTYGNGNESDNGLKIEAVPAAKTLPHPSNVTPWVGRSVYPSPVVPSTPPSLPRNGMAQPTPSNQRPSQFLQPGKDV